MESGGKRATYDDLLAFPEDVRAELIAGEIFHLPSVLDRLPSPWGRRPIDVVPDWICEVLSPSNEAHDRVKKRRLYAASGVPFYWLIDPAARTLEALRLADGTWVDAGSFDDEARAAIPPFDAIELEVGRLFPPRDSMA